MKVRSKINPNYLFYIGREPLSYHTANSFYFHQHDFLQEVEDTFYCYVINEKKGACESQFQLSVIDAIGYSPRKAPFGSIDINTSVHISILEEFVDSIVYWAKERNISKLVIKNFPDCYDRQGSALIQNVFFNKKFIVSNTDIAQYLELGKSFLGLINQSERNRLNKCKREGFIVEKLETFSTREIYDIILRCKERKGYPTGISFEEFHHKLKRFPETYLVFGVKDKHKLLAVSICVVINGDIIYDFMHGHLPEYDKFSPVVLLIQGVYDYFSKKGYSILDLGLSSESSNINSSLYKFKQRLGAIPTVKHSFEKVLD